MSTFTTTSAVALEISQKSGTGGSTLSGGAQDRWVRLAVPLYQASGGVCSSSAEAECRLEHHPHAGAGVADGDGGPWPGARRVVVSPQPGNQHHRATGGSGAQQGEPFYRNGAANARAAAVRQQQRQKSVHLHTGKHIVTIVSCIYIPPVQQTKRRNLVTLRPCLQNLIISVGYSSVHFPAVLVNFA